MPYREAGQFGVSLFLFSSSVSRSFSYTNIKTALNVNLYFY